MANFIVPPAHGAIVGVVCANRTAAAYLAEDLISLPYPPDFGVIDADQPHVLVWTPCAAESLVKANMTNYGRVEEYHAQITIDGPWLGKERIAELLNGQHAT